MIRSVALITLLILAVTCVGMVADAHTTATQSGLDPDVAENTAVDLNYLLVTSYAILAALAARFISQVKLSKQILLGFFFYSWRNSIYGRVHQILPQSILRPSRVLKKSLQIADLVGIIW